jgi:CDP-glycerol glycerophosphotransferase (TagB/SpsB family)
MFASSDERRQKKIRSVHCPHGNSDKGHSYRWMERFAEEDIVFLYGKRMINFLKEKGVFDQIERYVITGNYRYLYYRSRKAYYDALVHQEVFSSLDPKKKTILYAPTWNQGETSFFSAFAHVCDGLPEGYNLIVKLHPAIEIANYGVIYRIISSYEGRHNILFLKDFPLVYPLLDKVDIYLGDMSSVGYDFLHYNRPMFFLDESSRLVDTSHYYLFQAGIKIAPADYPTLYQVIAAHLPDDQARFGKIRRQMYEETFGSERSFEAIGQDLQELIRKDHANSTS